MPATIGWSGSTSAGAGDLVLRSDHLPPGTPGFFFHAAQAIQLPVGNGMRCAGGDVVRLPVVHASAGGTILQPFAAAEHGLGSGATFSVQIPYVVAASATVASEGELPAPA